MANIVIINPRFDASFWGMEHCMPLLGKRANLPVACLALLAALVPDHHDVTLVDENVEDIDFDKVCEADLVCLTGMSIQGRRMGEIIEEVKARGVMIAVGGPMATVEPEQLEDLADVLFVGEADETWPQFLRDWENGTHKRRYVQADKTDVTTLPLPRVELLKADRYMFGSMQISRGCPFTCEFCDIIVTFGRKPRLKTSAQVIAELEVLQQGRAQDRVRRRRQSHRQQEGDQARAARNHRAGSRRNEYPLVLFTEASLDLAEDDELMQLMGLAGFQSVFIGIETPNEDSLRETKKLQNVRPNAGTLLERVHRVQQHGIDVWCGMIVGFDHDDPSIFQVMPGFLSEARISAALIGMLHAIPTTPLYDRLKKEGRLNDDEAEDRYGTNVIPLGMSREQLSQGFVEVMQESYTADAYFERLDALFIDRNFKYTMHQLPYWKSHRLAWAKRCLLNYVKASVVASRLLRQVEDETMRSRYKAQLKRVARTRWREPHILFVYTIKVAMHYHFAALASALGQAKGPGGSMPNAGRSFSRLKPRQAVEKERAVAKERAVEKEREVA